jgi:hypothetical protein
MISVKQPSNNQNQSYQIETNSKSSNQNCRPKKSNNLNTIDIFKNAKFEFL